MKTAYSILLSAELLFAVFVIVVLFKISAPYGKFQRRGWGKKLPARYSWLIMELPAVIVMILLFYSGNGWKDPAKLFFLFVWQFHYFRRTFIYPLRLSKSNKQFPILLMSFAFLFNCMNGFINGYEVFIQNFYSLHWLQGPAFYVGILVFMVGYRITTRSEKILTKLKTRSDESYKIPQEGLFQQVSSPHYLGEMIEWLGWAILTWSLSGFVFFLFTIANLLPRAYTTHQWYKDEFPDYPKNRKILIPGVW